MVKAENTVVLVAELNHKQHGKILAYPNPSEELVEERIRQLKQLHVSSLDFQGSHMIDRTSILGKGVVGMVVAGLVNSARVAVKIRRTDSRRSMMIQEATMLRAANHAGVGPKYVGSTRDVLVMDFFDGRRLPVWLEEIKGRGQRQRARSMLRSVLEQMVRLDAHGLDHGELSRAHKNVLVSNQDQACIVDFESASQMRRVNNFTSLVQYFFLGESFGRKMAQILGSIDKELLVSYLRMYKSGKTNDGFAAVQKLLKLE